MGCETITSWTVEREQEEVEGRRLWWTRGFDEVYECGVLNQQ